VNDIQVNRYDVYLRRLFDIKAGTIAGTVAPEIVPVLGLEPEARPENEYLRANRLFSIRATASAVAGEYSFVRVRNSSSDRVMVFSLIVSSSVSTITMLSSDGGALADVPESRDTRYQTNAYPAGTVYTGTTVNTPPAGSWYELVNFARHELPWILGPLCNLTVKHPTINSLITVNLAWRERYLEKNERT
jgi:hypothetical protein